jgi:hypothetical protein
VRIGKTKKGRIVMKNVKIVAAATATAVAVAGLTAGAAAAAAGGWITHATTSYSSPSKASAPVHFLAQRVAVETLCFTEGQQLGTSNLWFRISKDGKAGFVHRDTIGGVPSDLRHC